MSSHQRKADSVKSFEENYPPKAILLIENATYHPLDLNHNVIKFIQI